MSTFGGQMERQRDLLQIHLLGGFSLTYDKEQLPPLPSRHARLLFAWLALQGGRAEPRALLCDRLWPDTAESRARRRLSHALWQVQDAFSEIAPDRPYLLTPGDTVQFDADAPYWLDVEEFEERLDEVNRAGDAEGTGLRHLRRCVELYQGDLLAGSYEDWVLREQERLRQRHVTALSQLVQATKQQSNFEEALTLARRLTHQAPLREDGHREVMRLFVLLGQPSQALEQFERCRSVMEEELGTEPSAATVQLYERIAENRSLNAPRRAPVEELATRRLVGRDEERTRLVDQLERTLGGDRSLVFVEGEPGVGKSQLLAQTGEDARWRGFTVLWGSCAGPGVPYGPIREALLPELDAVQVAQLRARVEPVWLEEAGRLLPPLRANDATGGASTSRAELEGADGAERMRQALAAVMTGLAASDPVVLVLEDLHRADHETMSLLRTLARHPDVGRLLTLVSFRDTEAREDPAVWDGLRELDRDARPTRITLQPLTAFETGGLLREVLDASELPSELVESVHRECGGNPLYVLELLRALRDTGALGPGGLQHLDKRSLPVTDGLRALIASRIEHLGDEAMEVAEFGAVLGGDFALSTLEIGSPVEPRARAGALGELARRNLLAADGDRWHFTHAATRRVVLDQLDEDRARALHRSAADALETTHPDEVEALAEHLRAADEPRRALPYLRLAATRAMELQAHATAARHLDAAIELGSRVPTAVEDRVALLLDAETVFDVLGRRDRQDEVLDELSTLSGDEPTDIEILLREATYLGHVDRLTEAVAVAEEAVNRAEAAEVLLRGRALTSLGQVLGWAGENERSVEVLREATGLLGDQPADEVRARYALGTALRFLQRFEEADVELSTALDVAENGKDQAGTVLALGGLAALCSETGRTEHAGELYDRAVDAARSIGFRHREGVSLVNLGTVRLVGCQPGPALDAYDQAETVFRALGNRRGLAMVQLNRAWLSHRWLGQDESAEQDARSARDLLQAMGSNGLAAIATETLAGIARRRDTLAAARQQIDAGLIDAEAAKDRRARVQLLRGRVELELAAGDDAAALSDAVEALGDAQALGLDEFVGDLASLAAVAAVAGGKTSEAARHAKTAAGELSSSGEPHRIHHRLAHVARERGDGTALLHHETEAAALLDVALEGLPDLLAQSSLAAVPTHGMIEEAGRAHQPQVFEQRLARSDAPRGRALESSEFVQVQLEIAPTAEDPSARRGNLLDVLDQIHEQGAEATVDDLALLFDVSASTVRRDLRTLREKGHEATTRGRTAG